MTVRVFYGCVVVFWLAMMGALVKVELLPKVSRLDEVPVALVVEKTFANPIPARLNVYYQQQQIGFCTVTIQRLASTNAQPTEPVGPKQGGYWVQMQFTPTVGSPLKLIGDGWCDARYELQKFNVKVSVGRARLNLQGDNRTKKIDFVYDDGETHQERQFGFNSMAGGGLAGALGGSSLSPAALFGGMGIPATAAGGFGSIGEAHSQLTTAAYRGQLLIGELAQKAYLIESKSDSGIWARIWVDESGEVLLVETSMGFAMRSEQVDDLGDRSGDVSADRSVGGAR